MSDTTLAAKRTNHRHQGVEDQAGKESATSTPRRGWTLGLLTVVGTFILGWLLSPELRSGLGQVVLFLRHLDAGGIHDWILSFGFWTPVAYFLLVVGQVILNPIPAGPVTLAGALVFGVLPGLALSMAGSVVGSILVFVAVRRWGKSLVLRIMDEKTYAKYADKLGDGGWWFLFIMLLPLMPDDAVCALAGLSAMSFWRYVAFMVVGRLPGATLTAMLASDTITGSMAAWITVGIVLAVLAGLGFICRKRLEAWVLRRAGEGDGGRRETEMSR